MDPTHLLIDIEGGGFDPKKHAFLEFGWALTDAEFNVLTGDSIYVLPQAGRTIEDQAAAVNGYTEDLWTERGAVPIEQAAETIKSRLAPYIGLPRYAHNAPYDIRFCSHYLCFPEVLGDKFRQDDEGKTIPAWNCSQKLLREYCKKNGIDPKVKGTLTLENGCKLASYHRVDRHGAMEDCYSTAALLRFLHGAGMLSQAA